jgi:hypothetical protein
MGNIESVGESSSALRDRLHALESAIRDVEAGHREALEHHLPLPGHGHGHGHSPSLFLWGAELRCDEEVKVLTGPVVGRVTPEGVTVLLEVGFVGRRAAHSSPHASLTAFLSLSDGSCPRGRVIGSASAEATSGRALSLHVAGDEPLKPGRSYSLCFSGVRREDAAARCARFRLSSPGQPLTLLVLSGDAPNVPDPSGESMWTILSRRLNRGDAPPVDAVLHLGGQVGMRGAFEEALALLKGRRSDAQAMMGGGGWEAACDGAAERMREAYRRHWAAEPKRAALSSAQNIMLPNEADLHPRYFGRGDRGGEADAVRAARVAARRVWEEYQGGLLPSRSGAEQTKEADAHDMSRTASAAAQIDAASHRVEIKQRKVLIVEAARMRVDASTERAALALEGALEVATQELAAARRDLVRIATELAAAHRPKGAGGILELSDSTCVVLLDAFWTGYDWDGRQNGGVGAAWETGDLENLLNLKSDSEMRFLVIASALPVVGSAGSAGPASSAELLDTLFRWRSGEAWREVLLLCGGSDCPCEMLITDSSRPGQIIRQLVPGSIAVAGPGAAPGPSPSGALGEGGRFSFRTAVPEAAADGRGYLELSCHVGPASPEGPLTSVEANFRGRPGVAARLTVGPVIGRVTQTTAIVLAETEGGGAVQCTVCDGITGQERSLLRVLPCRRPFSFFFEGLLPGRYYTVRIKGADPTGSFTTLPLWISRGLPHLLAAVGGEDGRLHDPRSAPPRGSSFHMNLSFVHGIGDEGEAARISPASAGLLADALCTPWPGADWTIHLGGQVNLTLAIEEATSIVYDAVRLEEGSAARKSLEELALDCLRDAYRFTWGLPHVRQLLSHGAHIPIRSHFDVSPAGSALRSSPAGTLAESLLSRLLRCAFEEYQAALWRPSEMTAWGVEMGDPPGYRFRGPASGGAWQYHVFGECAGLFLMDLNDSDFAPEADALLSERQWAGLRDALSQKSLRLLYVVCETPFVLEPVGDALVRERRAARSSTRGWPARGGELYRLLSALWEWKMAEAEEGDEPLRGGRREVVLVGAGIAGTLETIITEDLHPSFRPAGPGGEDEGEKGGGHDAIRQLILGQGEQQGGALSSSYEAAASLDGKRFSYSHTFLSARATPLALGRATVEGEGKHALVQASALRVEDLHAGEPLLSGRSRPLWLADALAAATADPELQNLSDAGCTLLEEEGSLPGEALDCVIAASDPQAPHLSPLALQRGATLLHTKASLALKALFALPPCPVASEWALGEAGQSFCWAEEGAFRLLCSRAMAMSQRLAHHAIREDDGALPAPPPAP